MMEPPLSNAIAARRVNAARRLRAAWMAWREAQADAKTVLGLSDANELIAQWERDGQDNKRLQKMDWK